MFYILYNNLHKKIKTLLTLHEARCYGNEEPSAKTQG